MEDIESFFLCFTIVVKIVIVSSRKVNIVLFVSTGCDALVGRANHPTQLTLSLPAP